MPQFTGVKDASLPAIALILATIFWASSFIALKIAFRGYDPMVVIFGRMLVASLCFLAIGKRVTKSLHYQRGDYKLILFMGFCEPCLYFIFEAKAVQYTTASQAGMITGISPILVMIAAALILGETVRKKSWLGAIVAFGGIIWLTLESTPSEHGPNPRLGNILEVLAMVCATGYTIALKSLSARYSPFFLTATQAFIGCFFFFPLLFLPSTRLPEQLAYGPGMAIIYLGAVITLGAYGLYSYGVKHLPASIAVSFINLIPIFSVIMGWLILGETLNPRQLCAGVLIIGGVYLSQKK